MLTSADTMHGTVLRRSGHSRRFPSTPAAEAGDGRVASAYLTSVTGTCDKCTTLVATEPSKSPATAPMPTGAHDDAVAGCFRGAGGNLFCGMPDAHMMHAWDARHLRGRPRLLQEFTAAVLQFLRYQSGRTSLPGTACTAGDCTRSRCNSTPVLPRSGLAALLKAGRVRKVICSFPRQADSRSAVPRRRPRRTPRPRRPARARNGSSHPPPTAGPWTTATTGTWQRSAPARRWHGPAGQRIRRRPGSLDVTHATAQPRGEQPQRLIARGMAM